MKAMRLLYPSLSLLALAVACPAIVRGQDSTIRSGLTLHGYVKGLSQTTFLRKLREADHTGILHARVNLAYACGEHWRFRLETRQRLFAGNLLKQPGFTHLIAMDYGFFRLSETGNFQGNLFWHGIVDRAAVSYRTDRLELIAGRQRINWGIGTVWNPNDVFNAFNFFDFDYEERPGCDGIRAIYNLKGRGSLEMAGSAGSERSDRKAALLWRSQIGRYDIQALGGKFDSLVFAGAGFAGNLGQAGFKGEYNLYRGNASSVNDRYTLLATASLDYTFQNGWYLMGTYLYQSRGGKDLSALYNLSYQRLSPVHLMPLKHSFAGQLAKQINPVLNASFTSLYSPTSHLSIFMPSATCWMAQNWELTLLAQSLFARNNRLYQTLGSTVFLRVRYSF